MLVHILVSWRVSALALWLVALMFPGIVAPNFGEARIAAIVIGIVNATVGVVSQISDVLSNIPP